MRKEKHVLIQKMFTHELNMYLPSRTWIEKTVDEVETHCLSGKKKKVEEAGVNKEGDTVFWGLKIPFIFYFIEKGVAVNFLLSTS